MTHNGMREFLEAWSKLRDALGRHPSEEVFHAAMVVDLIVADIRAALEAEPLAVVEGWMPPDDMRNLRRFVECGEGPSYLPVRLTITGRSVDA